MKKSKALPVNAAQTAEDVEKSAEETMAMLMYLRDKLGLREFQPLNEVERPKSMHPEHFANWVRIFKKVEALHLECAVYLSLPASERGSAATAPLN